MLEQVGCGGEADGSGADYRHGIWVARVHGTLTLKFIDAYSP